MAHYAFLDNQNIVTEVIVGIDENELIEGKTPEQWYGELRNQKCLRTSYNKNIRKNFAGIGHKYDEYLDAFIPPKLYPSWKLNTETFDWDAPVPMPELPGETIDKGYVWKWVEDNLSWEKIYI